MLELRIREHVLWLAFGVFNSTHVLVTAMGGDSNLTAILVGIFRLDGFIQADFYQLPQAKCFRLIVIITLERGSKTVVILNERRALVTATTEGFSPNSTTSRHPSPRIRCSDRARNRRTA